MRRTCHVERKPEQRRARYGLVAAFSSQWHALAPGDHFGPMDAELHAFPTLPKDVIISLRHITAVSSIDLWAFYRTPDERALLEEALCRMEIDLKLPPSTTEPILRVGRGAHLDVVFLVERLLSGELAFTRFEISQ